MQKKQTASGHKNRNLEKISASRQQAQLPIERTLKVPKKLERYLSVRHGFEPLKVSD